MAGDAATVTAPDGTRYPLSHFLRERKQASAIPVTHIVQEAGISRANYYLLEKGGHRPSLATLVSLFDALGLDSRLPEGADSGDGDAADLVVSVGVVDYEVRLGHSDDERLKARERYIETAGIGLRALMLLGPVLGAGMDAKTVKGLNLASRVAGQRGGWSLAHILVPVAGQVLLAAAEGARERRQLRTAEPARSEVELVEELRATAESMSTEELEAVLATMKAMRDGPRPTPPDVPA